MQMQVAQKHNVSISAKVNDDQVCFCNSKRPYGISPADTGRTVPSAATYTQAHIDVVTGRRMRTR